MRYEEKVPLARSEIDRINRLLSIPSLEEMTDQELRDARANTDTFEGVFYVEFADGSTLTYDLCSGSTNYFDDVVWTSPDKRTDVVLDCEYELADIEFEAMGNTYVVVIVEE